MLEVPVGSVLLCEGDWKIDRKYGQQFMVQSFEEVMPATVYGIEKYLGSGLVKGIGPKFAQLIVRQFGTDTIDVIETDIKRLYEVPGIGKKRVEKIRESWEKQKDIKNVMLFLQGYGVSTAYAAKIYRCYGKESIDKVKENPYRLADAISGEAIAYTLPEDRARKEVLEKDYSTSGCGCGCLLMCIPPLLYFGLNAIDGIPCFLLSILALGLTGIIIHLLDRKHKKKKETLVAQALKRRQQLK